MIEGLPRFSYSRLNTFIQCPMKYKLKYVDGNYDQADAIHLDIGNIIHKVLEIKYRNIIENKENDYALLKEILLNGVSEETEKDKGKFINGTSQIMHKYGMDNFSDVNEKSGLSYNDKLESFNNYLVNDDIGAWKPFKVEQPFEFVFEDRVVFTGFIDRIDINDQGELRVVDYKTSNKVYQQKDLNTPLQMVIYALACEKLFDKTPIEFQYDLVLLGEKQQACTKGYYNRGIKKISKTLDEVIECEQSGIYKPKPTPLCHWCEFSNTNPNQPFYFEGMCEYYSLWTPDCKTFEKNKEFIVDDELDF